MSVRDVTITSLETITAFGITSGEYLFTLDELQNATIANTQDKVDITGKGGRKLSSIKRNKAVTVSGTNGLISGGLLELQTGNKFTDEDAAPVKWVDYLTVSDDSATTNYVAIAVDGVAGNEIENVYVKNADGTLGDKLTQDASVGAGKFTYNPETKKIAFNTDEVADGTEIVVYYTRRVAASVLNNISDVYSEKCQLYIDAFGEDTCGSVYRIQIYIPKADFAGNFDLEFSDNQSVHAFEAESLSGNCGGKSGTFWTYTIFGADADDAAA